MKCPHCDQEIPGNPCPQCESTVPEGASYCMDCGSRLSVNHEGVAGDEGGAEVDNGFDLEDRVLCPDGTCTGILIDGKCTECGNGFKGKEKAMKEQQVEE